MSRERYVAAPCSDGTIVAVALSVVWGQLSSPQAMSGNSGQVVGLLQFMTGESLQQLYHQLFGADDEDRDATSLATRDARQADLHLHAATQPVVFDKPAGLHLFKGWTSQQQQVRFVIMP